ncbi:MAG: DUF3037 domain-containing protein [Gammaproteobacteria bacterium]|nr:DUF3037 domain-containing protein [Gammaproteobacteria bacterium]MBU2059373.1 DUF3037 domain-containing protein [Gammaproteobacteria bacterium]MBU2175247.1 DUF3037 domain-containing protein [Gammaproteobacteria bacterium]MBU2247455.1 DUF3037 domain-containing protein [Gammaproteobacteria bacterium]MBU2346278.1 DUF3037 domain-containing protein [Gammaproteobacteria bacterium]
MKILYQYTIVRFLPFAETGEFANVGIVLCAPDAGVFAFQLIPTPSERVQQFFPQLHNALLPNTIKLLTDELNRIQQITEQKTSPQLFATFQELIRPREQIIRYSGQRSVLSAAKPAELLEQLTDQLVQS